MRLAVSFVFLVSASAFVPLKHAPPSFLSSSASTLSMAADGSFDFDVAIIGCGVGGHGAALHARGQDLTTAVFAGGDVGGTCVNRGCVPSKALLAASGRVRDMKDASHLESLGISVEGSVTYSREGIAAHAKNLANKVKGNLEASLVGLGCNVIEGRGALTGKPNEIKDEATGKIYTAKVSNTLHETESNGETYIYTSLSLEYTSFHSRICLSRFICFFSFIIFYTSLYYHSSLTLFHVSQNIILAPGSIPFVPPGIQVDEKTVYTSDGALELEFIPEWVAIIGSGYIGLEFSDVYTALGSEVTFIEALPNLMPTFDREIAKQAERLLIRDRPIDYRLNVFASEVIPGIPGVKPVTIKMIDAKTKYV